MCHHAILRSGAQPFAFEITHYPPVLPFVYRSIMPRRAAARKKAPAPRMRRAAKPLGDPLAKLREICLGFPDATEKIAWGEPTFRVRDKIFAMFTDNHHGDGEVSVWCKAPTGVQEILVGADPERFYVPRYVGHKGWVGIRLAGKVDWDAVAEIVGDSYRMTAPKRRA